jgi:hypothetical protein
LKKNAEHIAQPHTLAAFLPWGSFAGADRSTRRKGMLFFEKKKNFLFLKIKIKMLLYA